MNNTIVNVLVTAGLLMLVSGGSAQDFNGCTVQYRQTTRYDFEAIFGNFDNPDYNDWAASLPGKHETYQLLYLTAEKSMYTKDPQEQELFPEELRKALMKADYFQAPHTRVHQVFHDFENNLQIQQIEFMTRYFLVGGAVETPAWKLTGKKIKVLDYICMGAEMTEGEKTVSAWFTSEIPLAAGPAHYGGLPGLILVLEINGETAYQAVAIDPGPPDANSLFSSEEGKKVTREQFDAIRTEKLEEWRETRNTGTYYGKK